MEIKNVLCKLVLSVALFAMISCAKDKITRITPDDSEDYIENTAFDRTVYVDFSEGGSAAVGGTNSDFTVSVNGNGVTIVYAGGENIKYELSGSTANGFFKLYSYHKQAIILNGVDITNPNGAAINIQGPQSAPSVGRRTFLVVNGTNTLKDGTAYSSTPDGEDEKGVIFSEGQIIFSGAGTLNVTAVGKAGINSDSYLRFMDSPEITVTSSAGHGVRGDDYVIISGGTLNVEVSAAMKKGIKSDGYVSITGGTTNINVTGSAGYDSEAQDYSGSAGVRAGTYFSISGGTVEIANSGAGGKGISCDGEGRFNGGTLKVTTTGSNYTSGDVSAKGIKCDGDMTFSGANVSVNCKAHEGIESKGNITITGGVVYSYSAANDAINSAGDFTISGGYVCGHATSNDGLDANGDCYINGGVVYAIGSNSPEVAIDANTEENHTLYVNGGVIIAIGGLERGASLSQACYSASSWSSGTWYSLTVGSSVYAFKAPSSGGTPLVVSGSSTPALASGVTVSDGTYYFDNTLVTGASVSGGTAVSLSSYSGESGGGGGGTPPNGGGGTPPNGGGGAPPGH
ncbi:MAG: carbohydrate-binding domain-containing protein [Bacteroidales bacterium]|nr:carbohydrate-binding domain-containing protein [Bacteroidales bacterium]